MVQWVEMQYTYYEGREPSAWVYTFGGLGFVGFEDERTTMSYRHPPRGPRAVNSSGRGGTGSEQRAAAGEVLQPGSRHDECEMVVGASLQIDDGTPIHCKRTKERSHTAVVPIRQMKNKGRASRKRPILA